MKSKSGHLVINLSSSALILIGLLCVVAGWSVIRQYQNNVLLKKENQTLSKARDTFIAQHTSAIDTKFIASLSPMDVHLLVNAERHKSGLPGLEYDDRLGRSACAKADDMIAKDYWSHNDPSGGTPWTFITGQGISYRTAGENLGYGFRNGEDLVDGWMKSPGHRENILKSEFISEGLCFRKADKYQGLSNQTVVVQHFTKSLW